MTLHQKTIRIIFPASRDRDNQLAQRLPQLEKHFRVLFDPASVSPEESWPFTAASVAQRTRTLTNALLEPDVDAIWCGRGGYGMSDLLSLMPWPVIAQQKPKFLIGFSDIGSLHSAAFTHLRWPCLHAPMPGSGLWPASKPSADCQMAIDIVKGDKSEGLLPLSIGLKEGGTIDGWLFGGCLTVLTALIGTPHFPSSLQGAILFFEDVDENPGRLMRNLNQWHQSGAFEGVRGIVIGNLKDCHPNATSTGQEFMQEAARRFTIPFMKSELFGHVSPNIPLPIGVMAKISGQQLAWTLSRKDYSV